MLELARKYAEAGLSVVPIRTNGSKRPTVAWKEFQTRLMTNEELYKNFSSHVGVAVIGGEVSGGLEAIDIDESSLVQPMLDMISTVQKSLENQLPVVRTPSGGAHIYYRCSEISGNQKLAMRWVGMGQETLIETRGEGGYLLTVGCPEECHEQGEYVHYCGPPLTEVPEITPEQRKILLNAARMFSEVDEAAAKKFNAEPGDTTFVDGMTPGTDYNGRADISTILEPHGWKKMPEGFWSRPGRDGGHSAHEVFSQAGNKMLRVFSTNAHPLRSEETYSLFGLYAALNHDGDYSAAARDLVNQGFGEKKTLDRGQVLEVPVCNKYDLRGQPGRTDEANAWRFVQVVKEHHRYVPGWKKWIFYQDGRWDIDHAECRIMNRTGEVGFGLFEQLRELEKEVDDKEFMRILAYARKSMDARGMDSMIRYGRKDSEVQIEHTELNPDPWLFNCRNGTIDVRTGEFREHRAEDLIMHMAQVRYDPDAKSPVFDTFIRDVMNGDEEMVEYLQVLFGYCLNGTSQEHVMPIFYGDGRNGKSTLLEAIMHLMGSYALKCPQGMLMARKSESHLTEVADLHGTRLAVVSETPKGRLNESLVKEITGGDTIAARRMREDLWRFVPSHTVFMATNYAPTVDADAKALWARLHVVPFEVSFEGGRCDKRLLDRLKQEGSGILNWMVQGALKYVQNGLAQPRRSENATNDYRREEDLLTQFLEEECTLGSQEKCRTQEFRDAYEDWSGVRVSLQSLKRGLFARGIVPRKSHGRMCYIGVGINSEGEAF